MTTILSRRVEEEAPDIAREDTTLFIVGHGTSLNDNSIRAVIDQAELLAKRFPEFAAVHATFMEQEPFIENWATIAETPNAVVVPFFISDGLHSYQDIPVMLGFEEDEGLPASQKDIFRQNPYHIRGKTLYYTSAIGIEPALGEVLIDQVRSFRERQGGR
jgi:sirohydrochlorin cobaltochelatase